MNLAVRLADVLARKECSKCNGGGIDPEAGGNCTRCNGRGFVWLSGKEREAWIFEAKKAIAEWAKATFIL